MEKSKIEKFINSLSLKCEIQIDGEESRVALFKEGDLYIKFFKDKSLAGAINKAVKHHQETIVGRIK